MKEIIEGNKLIAEFMGEAFTDFHGGIVRCKQGGSPWENDPVEWLNYYSDWNLLMPVVEKIEVWLFENYGTHVNIHSDTVVIRTTYDHIIRRSAKTKIKATWLAVIQFIQWYNQSNPK